MSPIAVAKAQTQDFEAIFQLLVQLWPEKKKTNNLKQAFEQSLQLENQVCLVAKEDKKIIGFVSLAITIRLWTEGHIGHINEFVVDEIYREKGVGTELLAQITKIAEEKGCKKIELDSGVHREKAHKFYENKGFKKRGYVFSMDLLGGGLYF